MLQMLRDQRMLHSDLECSPKFIHTKLSPQPGTVEVCQKPLEGGPSRRLKATGGDLKQDVQLLMPFPLFLEYRHE